MVRTFKSNSLTTYETGMTASTTQTQGNGALTTNHNIINTVANTNDTVTLPSVNIGDKVTVMNTGANILQIFPASGEDLGNGTDLSTTLEENEEIAFFGLSITEWHIEDTTTVFHAEIHDEDNTTEFTINSVDDHHAYHGSGVVLGDSVGWTFDSGSNGTQIAISSVADNTGGEILVTTSSAHGISAGDIICHTGLTDSNYVGFFTVLTVPLTTTYTVTATYTATGTGFMSEPSYIQINDIAIGSYKITWTASLSVAGSGVTFDFFLHDGTATITGSKGRHKMASSSTFKMIGGQAIRHIISGDRIFFAFSNITDATNITIRDFSLITTKL